MLLIALCCCLACALHGMLRTKDKHGWYIIPLEAP